MVDGKPQVRFPPSLDQVRPDWEMLIETMVLLEISFGLSTHGTMIFEAIREDFDIVLDDDFGVDGVWMQFMWEYMDRKSQ